MKSALIATGLASASAATMSFSEFMSAHGKTYATKEELVLRRSIYAANVAKIEAHNAETAAGLHSFTMGVNKFADMTAAEWKSVYAGGYRAKEKRSQNVKVFPESALPTSVDWEAAGAVTPVKDQGQCGSCWAFSTTGSTEGAWVVTAKQSLTSLSEQQLVDCSGAEGNQGCNGGLMDYGFQYIIDNKGIGSEASYPYTATDGTCKTVPSVVTIKSFTDVQTGSEQQLMAAVAQQPISVAVEADQDSFQLYAGGVMTAACGTALDHGVLAVGYGTDAANGGDYWKVKNSWGANWGEKGYIRLGRGKKFNGNNGQCGIQMDPSYPTA